MKEERKLSDMEMEKNAGVQNVFLVGAKSLGAYGGYELNAKKWSGNYLFEGVCAWTILDAEVSIENAGMLGG